MANDNTQIQRLDKRTIEEAEAQIELVVKTCDMIKLSEMRTLEQAIVLARGITALKKVLTEQVTNEIFMPLQGSQLGFLTDKDKDGGYGALIVRNCWIQGLMWGLQPINNELNIIAEKAYAAKNGLERKVRQAVTDLIVRPGVPVASGDKAALLPMRAYWTFNGKRCELIKDITKDREGLSFDERYAIRVNTGMGPDAVIGKAYRKLYRDILAQITNNAMTMADGDVIDATGETIGEPAPAPAPPEQDGKRVHVSKVAVPAKQEQPSMPPPAKSEPRTDKPGLLPGEVKDIKRHAKEAGNAKVVEACERILQGTEDFTDVCDAMEYRNKHMPPPREIE